MRTYRCLAGLAGLVLCSVATGGTASAQTLNYAGQSAVYVNVEYAGLPADTQLFILNQVSGAKWAALVPLVSGSGSMGIPKPAAPGQYYVLAQQAGEWVAQTVMFYRAEDP